jgi:ATP-binding cassette, subfamily B, putative efflux pump
MQNIRKLYSYIADERGRLIKTAFISTGLGLTSIGGPLLFRYIINQLSSLAGGHVTPKIATGVGIAIGILVLLQLINSLFGFIQERLSDRLYLDMLIKLNRRVFEHMMELSIDFYEQTKVGETMTKVQNATFEFTGWLQNLTESTLSQIIQLILAVGLLWFISPIIGPVVLVFVVAGVVVQVVRIQRVRPLRRATRRQFELAGGHLNETITHIATIRSTVPASVPISKNDTLLAEARRLNFHQNNVEQRANLARSLVNDLAVVAAVIIVAWQSLHHHASPGDVVAVALYLQQVTGSVGPLGRLIVNTSQVETSVERIIELLETKATVVDAADAVMLDHLDSIEFRNVSFAYPGKKRRVLENISFHVDAGQTLALVGPSGTGKTTITKLMLRFYEPTSGDILINGRPIQEFTAESVRRHIGMVMQDVALFNESVEVNLQLANEHATAAEVQAAATQAHANVFIDKLPEKYETLVGERGVKLSGGEKQRIAIARAILKQPDLIILDEATSALDSESERHVQAGLQKLMTNRTAVIIAHRLSTVMRADQILVLRGGRIVEQGQHEDLAEIEGGLYAKLFKLQTEGFARL